MSGIELEFEIELCKDYREFVLGTESVKLSDTEASDDDYVWEKEISEIYTSQSLRRELTASTTWDRALLRHAYPIASTYSGNFFVQVSSGKYKGSVLHIDHETYIGDQLAAFVFTDQQRTFLKENKGDLAKLKFAPVEPSTDQIVEFLLRVSECDIVAPSFSKFLDGVKKVRSINVMASAPLRAAEISFKKVTTLKVHPTCMASNGNDLFVGSRKGLFAGSSPDALKLTSKASVDAVAAAGDVVAIVTEQGVSKSLDKGATFSLLSGFEPEDMVAIEVWGREVWVSALLEVWQGSGTALKQVQHKEWVLPKVLGVSRHGVLVGDRRLCFGTGTKLKATLESPESASFKTALEMESGTLIVLDDRCAIHRSADGGKSWKASVRPKIKGDPLDFWLVRVGSAVVVVADFVLVSFDDGESFQAVAQKLPSLRACATSKGRGYLLGEDDSIWEITTTGNEP